MKRILSIDGGGIRGIIPIILLMEIERRTGKRIHEIFDLIVGTSTGGIIALMLTKPNPVPLSSMLQLYIGQKGKKIFQKRLFKVPWSDVKFKSENIESVLQEVFEGYDISQCIKPTVITTYDTATASATFFASYNERFKNFKMWECARATSAAPTYFEPFEFNNMVCLDGGLFANNPALFGLVEAQKYYGKNEKFDIVSLGTGSIMTPLSKRDLDKFNILTWATKLFKFTSDGQSDTLDYVLDKTYSAENNYFRFQCDLPDNLSDLDNVHDDNLEALVKLAEDNIKGAWKHKLGVLIPRLVR
jgi:hypothetical protein